MATLSVQRYQVTPTGVETDRIPAQTSRVFEITRPRTSTFRPQISPLWSCRFPHTLKEHTEQGCLHYPMQEIQHVPIARSNYTLTLYEGFSVSDVSFHPCSSTGLLILVGIADYRGLHIPRSRQRLIQASASMFPLATHTKKTHNMKAQRQSLYP